MIFCPPVLRSRSLKCSKEYEIELEKAFPLVGKAGEGGTGGIGDLRRVNSQPSEDTCVDGPMGALWGYGKGLEMEAAASV